MSKFKAGDKVRALAKPTDPYYSNEGYFKVGEEFTIKEVFGRQGTVRLVDRNHCWHESRFELVEEVKPATVPQLPGIPEGYRAVRWGRVNTGETYLGQYGPAEWVATGTSAFDYVILEKIDQHVPVEPAKPEAPVAPAKKVAPVFKVGDKVRLVDNTHYEKYPIGTVDTVVKTRPDVPFNGDLLIFKGPLEKSKGMYARRFELVEKDKPATPTFKVGDKVKCIRQIFGCKVGRVYTILKDDSTGYLVFADDDGDERLRKWDSQHPEFELVTESPDDLVIQDRVPARKGIDFGWWVDQEKFDQFVPSEHEKWRFDCWSGFVGKSHGYYEDGCRLAIMCYRKDLPVLPTTEKIVLDEYVVWDTDGPKVLAWSETNPTIENDSFYAWDHAYPTGNTCEVEVPVVKTQHS